MIHLQLQLQLKLICIQITLKYNNAAFELRNNQLDKNYQQSLNWVNVNKHNGKTQWNIELQLKSDICIS